MSLMPPFTPGATVSVSAVATSTAATALGKPQLASGNQVMVTVESGGTQVKSFIKFGDSTVQATTSDTPLLPGTQPIFTIPGGATHFAVIGSGAGPTVVYVTSGVGE